MVKEGAQAPGFTLPSDGGKDVTLSQLRGKPVVTYFYPKDDATGHICSTPSGVPAAKP